MPLWHASEVAAIAYALQQIIAQRQQHAAALHATDDADEDDDDDGLGLSTPSASPVMVGKKCGECGAYAVIRKDGCDYCTQCGHVGTCG